MTNETNEFMNMVQVEEEKVREDEMNKLFEEMEETKMKKTYYHRSNPKYDVETQRNIAEEYFKSNEPLAKIAEKFGCSTSLVHRFVKRYEEELT